MTRPEAIKILKEQINQTFSNRTALAYITAIKALEEPEIVRCRDCKHSSEIPEGRFCGYGKWGYCVIEDDFFCKYGERREKTDA